MTGGSAVVSPFLSGSDVILTFTQVVPQADVHSHVHRASTPLPQTRCIYHIIDLVTKCQSWPFSKIDLDEVGMARGKELWDDLRAAVNVEDGSHEAICSAWQAITEFILVDFTSILEAAS